MRVHYLGPAFPGLTEPCVSTLGIQDVSADHYLVEVSDEAGVEGEVIEGDVLVVDESKVLQHGDLAILEVEKQLRLFRSHRVGGAHFMSEVGGGFGLYAKVRDFRGVVVCKRRIAVHV